MKYGNNKTRIVKHIGSGHTPEELAILMHSANTYVSENSTQPQLFPEQKTKLLHVDHSYVTGVTHRFSRDFLHICAKACGLSLKQLYLDMAMMRIIEPSSKRRTIELMERYFNVRYSDRIYRVFKHFIDYKEDVERAAVSCARTIFKEDFFFVLYDVTTLYFETHHDDNFRKSGFSKDDKSKQPQIVVGLLVTRSGFPLAHDVFHGKTFEGHTMLPLIKKFSNDHGVKSPIVVADAAMLSAENIALLKVERLSYIVGARLANTGSKFIGEIDAKLFRKDGSMIRLSSKYGDVICSFSLRRYRKDKREMEKQIERAKNLVAKNESGRRVKFVKKTKDNAVEFDNDLQRKTSILLGVKGYCTNISEEDLSNEAIIAAYHDLWHVEQAFRMSKSDLEMRPIFHRREEAVRAHVLLCFVALIIGKYLEIITGMSIRTIRDLIFDITDTRIVDTLTKEIFNFSSPVERVMESPLGKLVKKWQIPY